MPAPSLLPLRPLTSNDTVLLTGATGHVGGAVARFLLSERECGVRALVRSPEKAGWLESLGAEIVKGDLAGDLSAAVVGCQVVIHAAASVTSDGDWAVMREVNVEGSKRLAQAAALEGVERFVHVSTCSVYGSPQRLDIDETSPRQYKGEPYTDTKVDAEVAVEQVAKGSDMGLVMPRPTQVYGPGSYNFTVRPVEMIKLKQMVLINNGRHLTKPIYIDDAAVGISMCAEASVPNGAAYNITMGVGVPWQVFLSHYGRMLGVDSFVSVPRWLGWLAALGFEAKAKLTGGEAGLSRGALQALVSDNTFSAELAANELGFRAMVGLDEGMEKTETWLRETGLL